MYPTTSTTTWPEPVPNKPVTETPLLPTGTIDVFATDVPGSRLTVDVPPMTSGRSVGKDWIQPGCVADVPVTVMISAWTCDMSPQRVLDTRIDGVPVSNRNPVDSGIEHPLRRHVAGPGADHDCHRYVGDTTRLDPVFPDRPSRRHRWYIDGQPRARHIGGEHVDRPG